jgi:hypothetical protein
MLCIHDRNEWAWMQNIASEKSTPTCKTLRLAQSPRKEEKGNAQHDVEDRKDGKHDHEPLQGFTAKDGAIFKPAVGAVDLEAHGNFASY